MQWIIKKNCLNLNANWCRCIRKALKSKEISSFGLEGLKHDYVYEHLKRYKIKRIYIFNILNHLVAISKEKAVLLLKYNVLK